MGVLHLGLSCNVTASEIKTSNVNLDLDGTDGFWERGVEMAEKESCENNESEQSLWLESFLYHLHAI